MSVNGAPTRSGHHDNAYGFLRLLFASLVIVAHTPEMVDGNGSREPLKALFGTITFGDLAVDAFFIISGILITGSYLNSRSVTDYLIKRVARIYPAFIVCSLFCLLIVTPLGGGKIGSHLPFALGKMVFMLEPPTNGAFVGMPVDYMNAPMWTIQIEFKCYLLVILLAAARVLNKPAVLAAAAIACLVLFRFTTPETDIAFTNALPHFMAPLDNFARGTMRLAGMFMAGACLRAMGEQVQASVLGAICATIVLLFSLTIPDLAEIGVGTAGAYLIYAVAILGGKSVLSRINNPDDISYGVYLYAFPIANLMILWGITELFFLGIITWIAAAAFGIASWFFVEKPVLDYVRSRGRVTMPSPPMSRPTPKPYVRAASASARSRSRSRAAA